MLGDCIHSMFPVHFTLYYIQPTQQMTLANFIQLLILTAHPHVFFLVSILQSCDFVRCTFRPFWPLNVLWQVLHSPGTFISSTFVITEQPVAQSSWMTPFVSSSSHTVVSPVVSSWNIVVAVRMVKSGRCMERWQLLHSLNIVKLMQL